MAFSIWIAGIVWMHHPHTSRQCPLRRDTDVMLKYILFGAVVALIIGYVIYTVIRNRKIRKNGVETEAVVSRIEEEQTVSSEDGVDYTYTHYVTYRNPQGETVEAKLGHAPGRTQVGDTVKIKYLPEKPHFAVLVK